MPTATRKSTEVAKAQTTAVAASVDYGKYAGAGFQGVDSSFFSPPFINILQSLSAPVKSRKNVEGDIYNTSTGEGIAGEKGIVIIPCAVKHSYVEWRPNRGGFVGEHQVSSPVVQKALANPIIESGKKFPSFKNGENVLQETFTIYGLLENEYGYDQVIIPFTSTKITAFRRFMTIANGPKTRTSDGQMVPYPLFAHRYRFTTKSENRASGDSFNWLIKFEGANADEARLSTDSDAFLSGASFFEIITANKVKADYGKSQDTGKASEQEEDDDQIPF